MCWEDSEEIARALADAYPDVDPLDLSFTKLYDMILKLPEFDDDPKAVSEARLEAIQMAWYELKAE